MLVLWFFPAVNKDQSKLIKIQEQGKKKLESELDNFIIDTNKQTKQILTLERQKNSLAEEQLNLTKKIEDSMDDIKLKKVTINSCSSILVVKSCRPKSTTWKKI